MRGWVPARRSCGRPSTRRTAASPAAGAPNLRGVQPLPWGRKPRADKIATSVVRRLPLRVVQRAAAGLVPNPGSCAPALRCQLYQTETGQVTLLCFVDETDLENSCPQHRQLPQQRQLAHAAFLLRATGSAGQSPWQGTWDASPFQGAYGAHDSGDLLLHAGCWAQSSVHQLEFRAMGDSLNQLMPRRTRTFVPMSLAGKRMLGLTQGLGLG